MRFGRAFDAFTTACALSLLGVALTLACTKTGRLGDPSARRLLYLLATTPFLAAAIVWIRKLPPLSGAIALDREAGLHDRLTTALAFSKLTAPSPFQRAAIEDGVAHASEASAKRAVKIPLPRDWLAVFALIPVVVLIAYLEVRKHIPIATAPTINSLELPEDDLDALAEMARQLKDQPHADPDMRAAVEQFNRLVEEL
ncbi:MAG: hypothetical protein NVS3B20_19390 [Polyangiales bacterium]